MVLPLPRVLPIERRVRRILLRLPNWMGDVVMAAPAVEAIGRASPGAELVAQAQPALLGLAALLPGVERTLPAGRAADPRALLASRRRIREGAFDAVVVFPRGARAMLAPRLAGVPVRVGFSAPGHALLLTHPVRDWRPWRRAHRSAFFGLLALPFGAQVGSGRWALEPPDASLEAADRLLRALGRRRDRPLVVLEAGASFGPAKCWSPEHFGALAGDLLGRGIDVLTVGTARARHVEETVAKKAGPGLLRAAGRTPDPTDLVGVLARADLVIANDTGPMHLAAALGTPLLALFGATDPVVSAPAASGPCRLLYDPEPCSPCFLRQCPVPGHPCLEKFGVEQVRQEALEMLDRGA